jgi:hypothetical protein
MSKLHSPTDRTFGLVFAGFFLAIAGVGAGFFGTVPVWAVLVSGGFASVALVAPIVLLPLNRLWALLGRRMGLIVNTLLLGVVFFLVFLPIGLAIRLLGRDTLKLRNKAGETTWWTPVSRHTDAQTLTDHF